MLEKLEQSGEAEAVRRRHARFLLVLAEEAEQRFFGPEHATWLDRLEVEHDNMRAALSWTLRDEDPSLGPRLATAIWKFWATRGYFEEAARWLQEALAKGRTEVPPAVRAGVLLGLGCILRRQSDFERARAYLKESLGLYEELGDRGRVAKSLEELAWVESYRGNDERATALYQEALALGREVGNKRYIAIDLWYLGIVATLRGDPNRAKALLKEALTIDLELKQWDDVAEDLKGLAEAAGALGEDVRAARLWGAAGALRDAIGDPWRSNERRLHEPQLIAAQSRIDEALWEAGFAEGRAMGLEKAVEYALSEEETYASTDLVPDRSPPVEPTGILTRREEEVAAMIAKGLSNRQIAQELYLSERTIENHVSKILRKLDLTSRTKIAAWETQQRLIAPNPD